MRKFLLSLAVLGTIAAAPVCAAPTLQPALATVAALDQGAVVQPVQYAYGRREIRRREELRRRREFRRRQAIRRGYVRPY